MFSAVALREGGIPRPETGRPMPNDRNPYATTTQPDTPYAPFRRRSGDIILPTTWQTAARSPVDLSPDPRRACRHRTPEPQNATKSTPGIAHRPPSAATLGRKPTLPIADKMNPSDYIKHRYFPRRCSGGRKTPGPHRARGPGSRKGPPRRGSSDCSRSSRWCCP